MNITIEHIRISLGAKFQLTLANFFFEQIFAKRVFPVENGKKHLCVRPWSLLTILNFSLLTILNFSARGPTDTTLF